MEERVSRFAALFRGSPRAHGRYEVSSGGQNGHKIEGQRWTVHEAATDEVFSHHLGGRLGLGAVPLLLVPPGTTVWAAIDIDDYAIDLVVFVALVVSLKLPVVVCRTKSGGAHVYVFFAEPISARLVRQRLATWATSLGYPNAEVFPKQDALAEREEDSDSYWGNWINLPYQGGNRSTRYALSDVGKSMSLDEFLDVAESRRLTEADLLAFKVAPPPPDQNFPGAPPCLIKMAAAKVSSGGRNQALFTAALYYKRLDPVNCENLTRIFNDTYLVPPLTPIELTATVRAAQKKDFNYRCKEFPMVSLCDRKICEDEEFGIRHGRAEIGQDLNLSLGKLVKILTTPPIWRWLINEVWVELTTEEFMTQRLFLKRVLEEVNARSRPVKPRSWEAILDAAVASCTIEVPPQDATASGQLMFHLNRFCTGRAQARNLDELILAKPFTDPVSHRTCFRVSDLLAYLGQQRLAGISERYVYTKLRDFDLKTHDEILKGKRVAFWSLPEESTQLTEFDPPREDVAPL